MQQASLVLFSQEICQAENLLLHSHFIHCFLKYILITVHRRSYKQRNAIRFLNVIALQDLCEGGKQ